MRKLMWMSAAAGAAAVLFARRAKRMSLAGKGVLITGGSRGLGLELARAFSDEGARIALIARDPAELERAAAELKERGAEVITVPCDLRDERATQAAVDEVAQRLGRLDVLVNNAGVIQVGPLEQMRLEDFRETMDVHFYAPLIASLAARPYLADRGGGRIVNQAAFPGLVTSLFAFLDRVLPESPIDGDASAKKGHESESKWAPSALTHMGDVAAERNKEVRP